MSGEIGSPVSIYSDGFEVGALGPEWSTSSSTPNGRVDVSSVLGTPANNGSFHLAMDRAPAGTFNRNEAILTIDLSSVSDAGLSFAHKDVNDEDQALPLTFVGSFNGDGVSISDDGTTWHEILMDSYASMNMWGFTPSIYGELEAAFPRFLHKARNLEKAEFFLPAVVNDLLQTQKARVKVLPTQERWVGMTYRADRPAVGKHIGDLIRQGVYPERLWG